MPAAVFLDRDGVLCPPIVRNGKAFAPTSLEDFRLVPDAAASVASLKAAGFLVIVVTNQPDIGNGLVSEKLVEQMHERLRAAVEVDDIVTCPHSQTAGCSCRKPLPGMLLDSARRFSIDLDESFMVGDRASDVAAGESAGCRTIFIDHNYSEPPPEHPDHKTDSLRAAADYILSLSPLDRTHVAGH